MSWLTEEELRNPSLAVEFDREDALDRMGGDEELLEEVLLLYAEDTPIQMQRMLDALERRDIEQVYRCAHSIKSASANVGARRASAYAACIEHLGRSPNPSQAVLDELGGLANKLSMTVDQVARRTRG